MINVRDILYSTEFMAGGYCEVLKVSGDDVTVRLQDYDGKIVNLKANKLKTSADAEFDEWMESRALEQELYPERPIEM